MDRRGPNLARRGGCPYYTPLVHRFQLSFRRVL